jgi:hypothetical protein
MSGHRRDDNLFLRNRAELAFTVTSLLTRTTFATCFDLRQQRLLGGADSREF